MRLTRALDIVASLSVIVASAVVVWAQAGKGLPRASSSSGTDISNKQVELVVPAADKAYVAGQTVIVEFADFQCPYSGRYAREIFGDVKKVLVDSGKVRYAVMDFPLEGLHPAAFGASEAARCADASHRFWDMREELFKHQEDLSTEALGRYAEAIGLDRKGFQSCMQDPSTARSVRNEMDQGRRAGITATPSFIIGRVERDGNVRGLRMVAGAVPYTTIRAAVESITSFKAPFERFLSLVL